MEDGKWNGERIFRAKAQREAARGRTSWWRFFYGVVGLGGGMGVGLGGVGRGNRRFFVWPVLPRKAYRLEASSHFERSKLSSSLGDGCRGSRDCKKAMSVSSRKQ